MTPFTGRLLGLRRTLSAVTGGRPDVRSEGTGETEGLLPGGVWHRLRPRLLVSKPSGGASPSGTGACSVCDRRVGAAHGNVTREKLPL